MSGFTIDITENITKRFDNLTKEIQQTVQDELNAFGLETVAMAKSLAPVDEGFLRNSITFDVPDPLSVEIIVAANYGAYLEFGTRGFAAIYVATLPANWQAFAARFKGGGGGFEDFFLRIHEWVKRKGIPEEAAYPIAIKILRNGIKASPFLYPAIEQNRVKLVNNLKSALK